MSARLPIVVGEFGHDHSDGNPDEDTIFATTQQLGLGYLAWSWSGNGGGVEYLDLVTSFNASQLTSWGQRAVNGANGIRATSREASVYGGGDPSDTTPPSTPGTPSASAGTADSATLTWSAATDAVGVTGYDVVRVAGSTETAAGSSTTTSTTITGLAAGTAHTFAVYARDAAGNRSARSNTVTVTTQPGGGGGCSVAYDVTGQWQGGFQGGVTVRNTATTPVDGWTLRWSFANGQVISQLWHGIPTQSGAQVQVRNETWNPVIAAGGSVTFGFTASHSGTNTEPTAFTLNGAACSTA